MMASHIPAPASATLLGPLLPALPTATISTQPAPAFLPLLAPILRQRVGVFSSGSKEPWLRLLCYDTDNVAKLARIVQGGAFEPHPISGEVEVDWEYDSQARYRRLDGETLHAFIAIPDLQLGFQLVYCVGDKDGGGDGWKVAEVLPIDSSSPFATFDGQESLAAAEKHHSDTKAPNTAPAVISAPKTNETPYLETPEEEDDDDDYWARYDATPARSPAPQPMQPSTSDPNASAEDSYFAQYDDVQPAMDNHDPDEARNLEGIAPPLGLNQPKAEVGETTGTWTPVERPRDAQAGDAGLVHPRPASSASSSRASEAVAKLEESAERQGQGEFGVKQHVSRSIRSMFLLSRSAGIDRAEFES
ncbi:hypothetical protein IMZ48_33135, partial [Candidatus Bathyarchaeota archaeon]|nr:hypothetical protein [Candidatus Bathyarchaeota archaeon]